MKIISLIFLFMLLFVSCGNDSATEDKGESSSEKSAEEVAGDDGSESSAEIQVRYTRSDEKAASVNSDLVSANSKFAVKLFKSLLKDDEGKNVFISPISISTALSMTMNGAVGDTFDGMQKTLEMTGMTQEQINKQFLNLLQSLEFADEDVSLTLADSIWIVPDYIEIIEKSFIENVEKWYLSGVYDATTPEALNSWIEEKTGGKIKDMIDQFPPDLVMYIVNAIYFKGGWSIPFKKEDTFSVDFTKADESTVKVDMMVEWKSEEFDAWMDDNTVGIRLPYGREKISFYAFAPIPFEDKSIDSFIDELDGEKLNTIINSFGKIDLGGILLPRFRIEYKKKLNEILKSLGMSKAFEGGFDKIIAPKSDPFFISRVLHKSFIEVNEKGAEAAAATVIETVNGGCKHQFRADKPFLFLIRDDRNGTILFMGKVEDPTK